MMLLWIVFVGVPVVLTGFNIYNLFANKQYKPIVIDTMIFSLGPILSSLLYLMWLPPSWDVPLHVQPEGMPFHEPIAMNTTILVFAGFAFISLLVLRVGQTKLPPLLIVLCMAGMYIGCVLSIVWILQLLPNINQAYALFPAEGYLMCLFPLNYIISTISLIRRIVKEDAPERPERKNRFLRWCDRVLSKSSNLPTAAFVLMWPLLGLVVLILTLFGQQPDAAIKAFTETSDWLLSQKVSPPPVEYEAHYLCTVAAGGHKKLVKPQRMGIRHGRRIMVNRQLCVANAFEDLICDRAPRFHRFIRNVYDRSGYPISKHIKTPLAADITYIIMKPLEWLFLLVLYLCDTKPEDRIARQYLPEISMAERKGA